MAVETEVPAALRSLRENDLQHGISVAQGVGAFSRVLNSRIPRVVVSTRDLNEQIRELHNALQAWHNLKVGEEVDQSKPRHSRPKLSNDYVAPDNNIERAIAAIWQDLLRVEEIGARDDFFELGGHSLLGTQVISRIYQSFNVQLPLRKLFEARTVEALAEVLEISICDSEAGQPDGSFNSEGREIFEI